MSELRAFISYSHENEIWLTEWIDPVKQISNPRCLLKQWQLFFRNKGVTFWYDREKDEGLRGGDSWRKRIFEEIDKADIAILLVTQSFVLSPFIGDEEMPRILARHRKGELEVLPILVQPTLTQSLDIGDFLQWTPGGPTPLSEYFDLSTNEFEKAKLQVLVSLESVVKRARNRKGAVQMQEKKEGSTTGGAVPTSQDRGDPSAAKPGKSWLDPLRGLFSRSKPVPDVPAAPEPGRPVSLEVSGQLPDEGMASAGTVKGVPRAPASAEVVPPRVSSPVVAGLSDDVEPAREITAPLHTTEVRPVTTAAVTPTTVRAALEPRIGTVNLVANGCAVASSPVSDTAGSPRIGTIRIVQSAQPAVPNSSLSSSGSSVPRLGLITLKQVPGPTTQAEPGTAALTQVKPAIGTVMIRQRKP